MGKGDRLASVRLPIVAKLRKFAGAAAGQGAFFAAVHSRASQRIPLAATLLASWLPSVTDKAGVPLLTAEDIEATLSSRTAKGEVLERSTVDLAIGRSVRVRRQTVTDLRDKNGKVVEGASVDYFVPLPQMDRTLMLVFSTPILPVADLYASLFDTIAATVTVVEAVDEDQTDDRVRVS